MFVLFIAAIVAAIIIHHAWRRAETTARKARVEYRRKLEEDWYEAQARQVQLFIR